MPSLLCSRLNELVKDGLFWLCLVHLLVAGQQVLVDVNARDAEDVPLLHWASINDRRGIVKYLLKQVSNRASDDSHKAKCLMPVNSSEEKNGTIGIRDIKPRRLRHVSITQNTTRQNVIVLMVLYSDQYQVCVTVLLTVGSGDARRSVCAVSQLNNRLIF